MKRKQETKVKEKKQFLKKCKFEVMAIIILAMAVAGCSSSSVKESGRKAINTNSNEQNEMEKEENGADDMDGTDTAEDTENGKETDEGSETADVSEDVKVEEQVLLEQDGLKITLKGLEIDGLMGPELKLLVENNSEQNLTIQTTNTSVNGIMIETLFSCDVAAGKSANDEITFMDSELEDAQVNILQNFELSFHIYNTETWDTVLDTDSIKISTNMDGSEEQAIDDEGGLLVDRDGIKVTVKEADNESSFWGADIYVYVENNTDGNITIQAESVSVNGFMVEPYFSCDIASNKKSYDTITFMEDELKENNIESIDDMEVSFRVFESDSFETIFETEALKVEFEKAE